MNEGISITIEPIEFGVKGLSPRLKYPVRTVHHDQIRGKSIKQICIEKNQRAKNHG
jgi:hypothetical protein